MIHLFLWSFLAEEHGQQHPDDGSAKMAFPRDVLRYGQGWNHTPNEAAVKKHHDERDDYQHAVATDEAARDEEKIQAIDKRTCPDMRRIGVADTPRNQTASQIGDEHHSVGEGGITIIQSCTQNKDGNGIG